jgi:6-phosphogluconolactonase (cycloisomerase 2 family)
MKRLRIRPRSPLSAAAALAVLALAVHVPASARAMRVSGPQAPEGHVYTLTNAVGRNEIVAFSRGADGVLAPWRRAATGGAGTGAGLGNQGAIALSDSGDWLVAVNPGSDSISVFLVSSDGLSLVDTADSGGMLPTSVTIKRGIVYALNAGSDDITAFRLGVDGHLSPIADSTRALSGTGTGAAEVSFNRAGDLLAVTEKATGHVVTFAVDGDGLAGEAHVEDSPTPTPFGFAFGRRDEMFVSEADGGAVGASAMSSYQLGGDGGIGVVTASEPSGETAACWVAATRDGRFAYTTNTGSDTVSSYGADASGALSLLAAVAAGTPAGGAPTDVAVDRNSRFLYVLNPGVRSISAYAIAPDGSLEPIGEQAVLLITSSSGSPLPTGLAAD